MIINNVYWLCLSALCALFSNNLWETGSTWLHAVKPIYSHRVVVKENAVFIAGHQARSPGQLVLKTPNGFQENIFKGQVREESCRVCDQLVHSSLIGWWWGNRAVSYYQSSGFSRSGSYMLMVIRKLISSIWWGF